MALIEIRNVSKTFRMGDEVLRALDYVSVKIEEGEFVSIVGPSGCGKSTLLNVLGLLDQPESGEYILDGQSVRDFSDDRRAQFRNQKIGFVFQTFNLLPRASALKNVQLPLIYSASYGKKWSDQDMNEAGQSVLARVGMVDRMSHRPNELSGGQRQRVAIARALINSPRLILADEPTGNLDSKSGQDILELFLNLHREGVTVILVTHDPKIAARAERVISMHDGKVVSDQHANS